MKRDDMKIPTAKQISDSLRRKLCIPHTRVEAGSRLDADGEETWNSLRWPEDNDLNDIRTIGHALRAVRNGNEPLPVILDLYVYNWTDSWDSGLQCNVDLWIGEVRGAVQWELRV